VVGGTTVSRGEVPGERQPLIRDGGGGGGGGAADDDDDGDGDGHRHHLPSGCRPACSGP